VGNGDVFSFVDWNNHKTECPELATCLIARGALIKVSIIALAQSHFMELVVEYYI
jgi:hypothetical protein